MTCPKLSKFYPLHLSLSFRLTSFQMSHFLTECNCLSTCCSPNVSCRCRCSGIKYDGNFPFSFSAESFYCILMKSRRFLICSVAFNHHCKCFLGCINSFGASLTAQASLTLTPDVAVTHAACFYCGRCSVAYHYFQKLRLIVSFQ